MMAKGCISSEVFLIFTTKLYTSSCNYNAIIFTSRQGGSIATGILPTPNTPLSSLPVGSNTPPYYLCRVQGAGGRGQGQGK